MRYGVKPVTMPVSREKDGTQVKAIPYAGREETERQGERGKELITKCAVVTAFDLQGSEVRNIEVLSNGGVLYSYINNKLRG